ncbi:MAG: hypothetical protein AVDCRST_MAG78-2981, partial [uncultured Rubrobacteraceae bacterium]
VRRPGPPRPGVAGSSRPASLTSLVPRDTLSLQGGGADEEAPNRRGRRKTLHKRKPRRRALLPYPATSPVSKECKGSGEELRTAV